MNELFRCIRALSDLIFSFLQMEAEEFQLEYENSLDDDDEEEGDELPFAKKRRSWKQHRIEAGEGRYACDQCDKVFSKQSSLARHKYEHSGELVTLSVSRVVLSSS